MAIRGMPADIVDNWAMGVITAMLPDRLPDGAVPAAKNTQFHHIGPNHAMLGTRHGATLVNSTILTSAAQSQHYLNTNGADIHIISLSDGDVGKVAGGSYTELKATAFANEPTSQVSWATFGEWAYGVNGADILKTDGTDVFGFGIAQPDGADWSVAAASSGSNLPVGTYDVVITYVNSLTGHQSARADVESATTTAGQRLQITLPSIATVGDDQVDYAKVYIQQSGVRNDFFLASAGMSTAIGEFGWALNSGSTTTLYFDATQAQLDAFTTLAPGPNDNYPPPATSTHVCARQQRLFTATGTDIYWSSIGEPEAFNPTDNYETIGEDGETITALTVMEDALIIFKRNSMFALVGNDPASWEIVPIDKSIGCAAHTTMGHFGGRLFWMSTRGPRAWAGPGNAVTDISTPVVGNLFDESAIDQSDLANAVLVGCPTQQYVGWAITPIAATTNTTIIPYNFTLNRWMSSGWEVVDVKTCTLVADSTGRMWPVLGDYGGYLYQLGTSTQDGMPAGQTLTDSTLTSSASTTLTNTNASWTTNVFAQRYVTVWSRVNGLSTAQRRRITSNTATALTVSSAWTTLPTVGDYYTIGGVLMDWWGAQRTGTDGGAFYKKRMEFLFLELESDGVGDDCQVLVYKDGDTDDPVVNRTLTLGDGAVYDTGVFDVAVFASTAFVRERLPIRTTGYHWQVRVLHMSTANQLQVQRTAVQWLTKTRKVGRTS